MSSWSPTTLSALSDYAQLLGLSSLVIAIIGYTLVNRGAHKRLLDHIRAHIDILRPWINGSGNGWYAKDVTVYTLAVWSSPGYSVIELGTPSALIPITSLDSVTIRHYPLKLAIIGLAQQLTSFNQALNKITLMQAADPILSSRVTKKLQPLIQDSSLDTKFKSVDEVYVAAQLNEEEELLARWFMSAMRSLNLYLIGNKETNNSLVSWVDEVESQLTAELVPRYRSLILGRMKRKPKP